MLRRCGKILLFWLVEFARGIGKTPINWCLGFWKDMTGLAGYRGVAVVIGAYVGVYSIVEASHERQMNLAAFERNMFITMVESGNRGSFVAAMKDFGRIQTMPVYSEPSIIQPRKWWKKMRPNIKALHIWAIHRLGECEFRECSGSDVHRIDLHSANLREAILEGVVLSDSDLRDANLRGANLKRIDLYDANLGDADLQEADLTEADLEKSDLRGAVLRGADLTNAELEETELAEADLRGAIGLTCKELQTAEDWSLACRDVDFACGADLPEYVCEAAEHRFPLD